MKKDTIKHMGVTIVLFAKYVVDQWYLPVQGATTVIIAQTAFAVYIWILNPEIERQNAAESWTPWVFGSEKMESGQLSTVAEDVDT